jgi:hypothetical protein
MGLTSWLSSIRGFPLLSGFTSRGIRLSFWIVYYRGI